MFYVEIRKIGSHWNTVIKVTEKASSDQQVSASILILLMRRILISRYQVRLANKQETKK